jgi:hypothetical protein
MHTFEKESFRYMAEKPNKGPLMLLQKLLKPRAIGQLNKKVREERSSSHKCSDVILERGGKMRTHKPRAIGQLNFTDADTPQI